MGPSESFLSNKAAMQPQARNDQLLIHDLVDETLVYDLARNKAHCLNRTAALVWRCCDGRTSPAEIARQVGAQLNIAANEGLVGLALNQLERARLLQAEAGRQRSVARCSRRDFARKLGIAVAAVPLVMTVLAPSAAMAGSCIPGHGSGCSSDQHPCCAGFTCVSGHCV
jgi:Coenzyme PQQ synthesis protein D (PqqD)